MRPKGAAHLASRRGLARDRFFARLVWGALWRRRARLVIALAALAVGSSVAAGLWLVARDVDRQVARELKAFGPNVLVVPAGHEVAGGLRETHIGSAGTRGALRLAEVERLRAAPDWSGEAADGPVRVLDAIPVLYGAARARAGGARVTVLVAGTDLSLLARVYDGWRRDDLGVRPDASARLPEAQLGIAVARQLGLAPGDTIRLEPLRIEGRAVTVRIHVVHETGGPEDDTLYLPLETAQELLAAPGETSLVLVRASGLPKDIHAALAAGWLAGARTELRPIRRMSVSEQSLLDRLGVVFGIITALALLAATLSTGSTLADLVLERRREVALLKALGAGRWQVLSLFLGEALALGVAGGLLGFFLGAVAAQVIGGSIFHSAIRLDASVLPPVVLLATLATLVASWLPVRRALQVQPAVILRGE